MRWLLFSVLFLAACGAPHSPIGQRCSTQVALTDPPRCPTGYTCRYDSDCDMADCFGTCVVSCASAPCGGACTCHSVPSATSACFPPADAGAETCER